MAKVPMVKCRKDVLTSTWTCCQGHQHHQNLRGEIPNWMCVLIPQHDNATQVQGPGIRKIQWERRPHDPPCKCTAGKMAPVRRTMNRCLIPDISKIPLTGNAAEWYFTVEEDLSIGKELADTFLAPVWPQLPNRTPDWFDRSENGEEEQHEIFREYTQWWKEMAASGMPPSRRERDDQDLRRYPEEPILRIE
uniref:Uncharacterized protein n=1 Tax=Fagus sylvatica TaxID=28930 RepID=A0A2N9I0S1_FAGSY